MDEIKHNFGNISTCNCKVARIQDKVYKDECMYCFNSVISEGGIFVCLSTLLGICPDHLEFYVRKASKTLFLNLEKIADKTVNESVDCPPHKKPTKLAIGGEDGFDVDKDKIKYTDRSSLAIVDTNNGYNISKYSLPNKDLPLNVQLSIAGVISHQGVTYQNNVDAWEDKRVISKHANDLLQLDNVKIPPSGWVCSRCDLTQNLWLNLTDGTILCGRRYVDGSGGNNHAVDHYNETKYPLAVKLGTITAEGGDVYSYDEDDMVVDPKLKQHLQHFGINIALLEKTDKTMTELEIEVNLTIKDEWDTIQEAGKKLVPLFGANYSGMVNLGNSCYMNSVVQVLFSMKEFQDSYYDNKDKIFQISKNDDPAKDFNVQMAKMAHGLLSGNYSKQPKEEQSEPLGVQPIMLKSLIGHGHNEFSTNHQQDAQEYFLHLMDMVEKNENNLPHKLDGLFDFQIEDRIECLSSHKVCYKKRNEVMLSLPIPLDAATNKAEYEEFLLKKKYAEEHKEHIPSDSIVRLNVSMKNVMDNFIADELFDDFYSSAIKAKTNAKKITRFATFPEYLVLQLRKFTINDDWTPAKLDISVDILDELDLTSLRSTGLQPSEELLPDDDKSHVAVQEPTINEEYVLQLLDMGFPLEACKKAVYHTKNEGVEAAMNWVFSHSQDADFAAPLQLASPNNKPKDEVNMEAVAMIVAMGFTEVQASNALKKNGNNLERAAEWIFTHSDELDNVMDVDEVTNASDKKEFRDGVGKYELFAFISHMGTSTSCGHYVCHIKKENRWVIHNDRKVAVSEKPPKNLGYLYFYRRKAN